MVPPSRPVRADDEMSAQESEKSRFPFPQPSASESAPLDVHVASDEPENSSQTVSTRRITFKRPPNPLDRAEPPKRTTPDDDDDSARLSVCHHGVVKVSENLNDENGVFSGTKMHGMLDSAWLAIKTKTQTSEPTVDVNAVESSQKDVSNLPVAIRFSLNEETIQQICSNPDPERQP